MIDLGTVRPGRTIRIPFGSYAGSTGASAATTGLAVGDIQIYKDGGTTQRASTAGYTVTADYDTLTGINLISINLADNTEAGFYSAGSEYLVVIADVTVDSQTVRFPLARFIIGYANAVFSTTIATLSTQTSFTLTSGPAEDNAITGCLLYIHDVASAVQGAFGYVTGYTGATLTVTLAAAPTFTIAATDNVSVFPRIQVFGIGGTTQTARDLGASVLLSSGTGTGQVNLASGRVGINWADVASPTSTVALTNTTIDLVADAVDATAIANNAITAAKIADNAITAAKVATDAIDADALAADAVTEIQSGLATAANQTTILNRLGAWTGSARNTILGALQALFRSDADATVPGDINADLGGGAGTSNNTTDSTQAIRDRGDAAWTTATGFSTHTANNVRDAILSDSTPFAGANIDATVSSRATQTSVDTVDTNVDAILADTGTDGVLLNMAALTPDSPVDNSVGDALTRARDALPLNAPGLTGGLSTFDDVSAFGFIGTVSDATPLAGDFDGDSTFSTTDDFYNGAFVVFLTGALKGIARKVSDYTGASRNFAFTGATGAADAPFPSAPSNGDKFGIIGRHGT